VPPSPHPPSLRGADIVAQTLDRAGLRTVFALSGNHIMALFDAALGTGLRLIHVRHEAAAVHMADAWGRLRREPGIALVTGGPGHANAVGALYTALAAESPLVLLSGHVASDEVGRGGFQEVRQAEMAAPVAKASWTARLAADLGRDIAAAVRIATSGRPGPVHVSLPVDLLDASVAGDAVAWPAAQDFTPVPARLSDAAAAGVLAALAAAERPLILAGPTLCDAPGRALLTRVAEATGAPAIGMEGPRGLNDTTLGAFAEVLSRADLLVLLGKPFDYAIRFGSAPLIDPGCRFVAIDPDAAMIARAAGELGPRLIVSAEADSRPAAETLIAHAPARRNSGQGWLDEVAEAVRYRPPAWQSTQADADRPVHPLELCRAIQPIVEQTPGAVLVCEGGEIGQWPQATLKPARRLINGVAGSIGAAIPFGIAARLADPQALVVVVMGDGSFGFHMTEFDTAVRYGAPFVVVLGNDAGWNAEHQIQLREYGRDRAHGCELLPTRYDRVVEALGGHGELVTRADELRPAVARAIASGKPACVNVMIARVPAPVIRRAG
jgi:thiamine pyrophosphate-dependent acetolactate synthase large subunit-like protein